jgi:hypothetical protein
VVPRKVAFRHSLTPVPGRKIGKNLKLYGLEKKLKKLKLLFTFFF